MTKKYARIINTSSVDGLTTQSTFDLTTLLSDEAIYAPLNNIGEFIIITLASTNKIKFEQKSETRYKIYENYIDVNSPITRVVDVGYTGSYETFFYEIGSVSGQTNSPFVPCFNENTMILKAKRSLIFTTT